MKRLECSFVLVACLLIFVATPENKAGDLAPDFKLPDLENKPVQLSELLKKGPVVVDFWATWCAPCIKYMPALQGLHEKYSAKGVTVVGINEDGPRGLAKIKPTVRSLNASFLILVDENNEVMRKLRVQVLPTTFLIASDGSIVSQHVGYASNTAKKLDAKINELLQKSDNEP